MELAARGRRSATLLTDPCAVALPGCPLAYRYRYVPKPRIRPAQTTAGSPLTSVCRVRRWSASSRRGPLARARTDATGRSDGVMAGVLLTATTGGVVSARAVGAVDATKAGS